MVEEFNKNSWASETEIKLIFWMGETFFHNKPSTLALLGNEISIECNRKVVQWIASLTIESKSNIWEKCLPFPRSARYGSQTISFQFSIEWVNKKKIWKRETWEKRSEMYPQITWNCHELGWNNFRLFSNL